MSANQESETISRKGSSHTGVYVAVAVVIIVILVIGVGAFAGWFTAKKTNLPPPGTCTPPATASLLGAGSTFVGPLMQKWETTYANGGSVTYSAVGSGAGISQITAKTVDFGASDAPLTYAQAQAAPGLVTIPETAGAVAVIYNLPGLSHIHLTGNVLAQIFAGTLTNWNTTAITSLNPGVTFPTASIIVVHRSDGSGTTYAFTQFLSESNATWKSTYGYSTTINWPASETGEKGSSGVAGYVSETADAIGYVDLTYALNNAIAFAGIQNPSGNYILPNITNVASAVADAGTNLPAGDGNWSSVALINAPGSGDYPISTFSYLMVYQDLSGAFGSSYTLNKAENLVDWLNWTITQGQTYSTGLYYDPLPASVIAVDDATLKSITYNGAALPICN
jgi:phosphate transport system substrate-binding protein